MTDCEGTCGYVARKDDPSNWHGEESGDWLLDREPPTGLEQEVWECPHSALAEREYCAFHTDPENLPAMVDEGELFVEAINEANVSNDDEVARRKKQFVGATFGPFNIEGATLKSGDKHPIRLDHASFTAGILADEVVVELGLIAHRTRVETDKGETVSFAGAEFSGDGVLSFAGAEFSGGGGLSFAGAEFSGGGGISFERAEFGGGGGISLEHAEFSGNGDLSFRGVEFSGDGSLSFRSAEFSGAGDLMFAGAEFKGDGVLLFERAEFSGAGDLLFTGAEFSGAGGLRFSDAEFSGTGDLLFVGAEFSGDGVLSFAGAEFSGGGVLSFEKAEISRECSFYCSQLRTEKEVRFAGAEVEELLTFEQGADERPRNVGGDFDFSNAVFHDDLRFRSSKQSTAYQNEGDDERPQFDLVFAGAVDFSGATFEKAPDFSRTRFPADTDFTDATLHNADFQNADVTGTDEISIASFDSADLSGVNFSGANLTGASFERALLSRAELLGADLTRTKLYGALLGDARVNRETTFWLRPDAPDRIPDDSRLPIRIPDDSRLPIRILRAIKTRLREYSHREGTEPYCVYDPRYRGEDRESDLNKAAETYGSIETLAHQNSLPGLASECFLGRKDVQLKQYWRDRNWLMIIRATVPTVVARYGESPTRVLGTGAVTIIVCGLVYNVFNLIEHTKTGETATLFESFYFSALTFTTLGYGDFNPVTDAGRVVAVAETSVGAIILAILVFVFGRRATR